MQKHNLRSGPPKKRHKPLRAKGLFSAPPRGIEQGANSSGNTGSDVRRDANSDAVCGDSIPIDPDLAAVVAAWPTLPESTRAAVLALVRAH